VTGSAHHPLEHRPFTDYLYEQPTDFDVVESAQEVAAARGVPTAQVALAWLLAKPGVTAPIVGSTKLGHLRTRWRPRN
jgi:aryl-alcohol dehydrogenase-like predicted oxidoreductase